MSLENKLYETIGKTYDYLKAHGVHLPDEYKRRDPREPERAQKEALEDKLIKALRRRLNGQRKRLLEYLQFKFPDRKSAFRKDEFDDIIEGIPDSVWIDPVADQKVGSLMLDGTDIGIDLFIASIPIGIDAAGPRAESIKWLENYLFNDTGLKAGSLGWYEDLDDTTKKTLKNALKNFIENPGVTIGDVMNTLSTVFDESRVERITITELTRMFAQGQQLSGEELAKEFPDVQVIKTWFTNRDDRVCPICGPLDGKSVLVDEFFVGGDGVEIFNPPAHVFGRCWTQTRTDILGEKELQRIEGSGGVPDRGQTVAQNEAVAG